MSAIWSAQDNVEPIAGDTVASIANIANYAVVSGCAATYSGTDMVVTIASGTVLHNGTSTAVAGNTVTLVSDPSNPRWTRISINSSGTAIITSGTAAATPTVPALGDNVSVALVYIQAGQTIATNCTYKLDKRVIIPTIPGWTLVGKNTAEQTTTSTSAVDLVSITLAKSITVDQPVMIMGVFRKDASAAQLVALGLKLNSTTVVEAQNSTTSLARSSGTQQAEDGWFECTIFPRSASYLAGMRSAYATKVSATGAAAQALSEMAGLTALLPNATITTVAIRGINVTSSNNLAVKEVYVYAGKGA